MRQQPKNPDPTLINDDIRPTTQEESTWSVVNMASLWVGMVVCVPTYMLAAGLISQGMNWSQAVITVLLGNVIVLAPMILNGHPGTKYGVPFPVLARASFGINGAHIPSMLRALVACGWFGIQTWVGGSSIYQLINGVSDGALIGEPIVALGINAAQLCCFLAFWAVQIVIIYKGVESIRLLETWAAPFLILMGIALLVWAYFKAGGFGAMLSTPSQFAEGQPKEGEFWSVFFPGLTAMVGFWATLSLNIPDFTRYAKSQRDQIMGQAIGLPTTMTLFAFIGVAVTSATTVIYGETIWDPTVLLGKMGGGFTVAFSLFALTIATLSTNIAANVVSPANAFININPQKISFQLGGYVTAGLGIAMMPWKLMADSSGYIFTWLIGYSALLGPIGGILVADYFLVRKTELDVDSLYRRDGAYRYLGGFNPAAMVALVVAIAPNLPGFLHQIEVIESFPALDFFDQIYTYAWFVGFFIAAVTHFVLMKVLGHSLSTSKDS
ncbi:MAG: NCS1 family nucleobase:cation symporter-1 [Planctomycetota bacterium]|jgi:NCS1 family nucleobase:cation symporter-1